MACESWKVIRKAIKTHLIELKTEFETLFPMTLLPKNKMFVKITFLNLESDQNMRNFC